MKQRQRSLMHLRIIGYFNILAIFLGLTRFRIDIKTQRVIHSRLVAIYVISANIAFLIAMPFFYIGEAINASLLFDTNLLFLTETVNMLINFAASVISVLLRTQREAVHLEITETVMALDRRHFRHMHGGKKPPSQMTNYSAQLLYFKMFTLCLQIIVPFYDWVIVNDELDIYEFLQTFYYDYTQSILAMAIFMYFYGMWVLWRRFCLLNLNVLELLRQLQRMPIRTERTVDGNSMQQQRRLVVEATVILLEIAQIHALLNRLLSHLNRDYKVPILAVLLKNVIECISFGFYFTSELEWEFDVATVLFLSYAVILFVDLNLVYHISDMTMDAHNQMSTIMRRFQLLPFLGDEFDQQCELFVMQLKRQQMENKFAGMFHLNRQRALALWAFSLTQIIVLVQFDVGSRLKSSTENVLLNKLDQLFRVHENRL